MMVIARVLSKNAEIIIMDEPTARLATAKSPKLMNYIKYSVGSRQDHHLHLPPFEEIFEVCDNITVSARRPNH